MRWRGPRWDRDAIRTATGQWLVCLVATAGVSVVLMVIDAPAAWLIGALVAACATALVTGRELAPHKMILRPAQGVIGVAAAAPIAQVSGLEIGRHLGLSAVIATVTLIICVVAAFVLWRCSRELGPATSVLSTLAGGASGISTMAPELDVDHRYVAMSQYLRLVIVTLTLPALVLLFGDQAGTERSDRIFGLTTLSAAVFAAMIFGSGYLGRLLHLPAPFLLSPLMCTLVLALIGPSTAIPQAGVVIAAAAYSVIGWQAGGTFVRSSLRRFAKNLPLTLGLIIFTIAGSALLALCISALTAEPLDDAYLATTPGGIYAALAVAQSSGAGPLVTVSQVFRLVVMLFVAILCAKYFSKARRPADIRDSRRSALSSRM